MITLLIIITTAICYLLGKLALLVWKVQINSELLNGFIGVKEMVLSEIVFFVVLKEKTISERIISSTPTKPSKSF